MNTEHQKAMIIHILYYGMVIALLYIIFHDLLYYILPFLIGFGIAFLLRPLIRFLTRQTGGHERLWSVLIILLFYSLLILMFTMGFLKSFSFLKNLADQLPALYQELIEPLLEHSVDNAQGVFHELDATAALALESLIKGLQNALSSLISSCSHHLVTLLANFASSLPNKIISLCFALISSFFFNADYHHITSFLLRQLSPHTRKVLMAIRCYFTETMTMFLIAYGKLMALTFIELSIGLWVLGIDHPISIALTIALFDILPVFGTGGIMLPWALFTYLSAQPKQAVGLLILYLIITLIRNIIEPRIVGKQIGLHPLVMLLCMYLGAKIFGILGIFILPLIILNIKNLNDQGILKLYKK